jgi:hypothetical protein
MSFSGWEEGELVISTREIVLFGLSCITMKKTREY